ncbi:MAG TPA: hypothetical protein VKH37_04875, partial [Ferruginibacter sp.]|nr:hypothetical protein [Ferruginibacter sp.]
MKRSAIITAICLLSGITANAQYYYNDIVLNNRLQADMAVIKEQKIKEVKVTSLEKDGTESEGFTCHKKFNRDYTKSELFTETMDAYATIFISYFNTNGLLQHTIDSSEATSTNAEYSYDEKGRLYRIFTRTSFSDDDAHDVTEDHIYQYGQADIPTQLLVIRNGVDTTTVLFNT